MASMTATRRQMMQPRLDQPQPGPAAWPLHAALHLGALPTAPGCARAWTRVILLEWQLAGLSDAGELIVSELATNALRASRREGTAFFSLVLTRGRSELAILVRDFCHGVPRAGDAGDEDESGRGLQLVQELSARSGWYPPDDGSPGKAVWAVLEAPPVASSDFAARFMTLAPARPERVRHLASDHAGPCTPRTHAASQRSTRDVRQP
jgi:anti-sigma regulatory factor (Ser/Thr protein kinase)